MGVEPYLVASSLEAVLAQRLVRVLCPHCKQPDNSATAQQFKAKLGIPPENQTLYQSPSAAANAATPGSSAGTRFLSGWTRTRKSAS
jgi:type II secretory ATPase GspE/PulE/Tfp pilus assembly ATPase PilB-like protein